MRSFLFRTIMLGALAIAASASLSHAPAMAEVTGGPGISRADHNLIVSSLGAINVAPAKIVVLTNRRDFGLHPAQVTAAEPLKREFAESYATNGLIFLTPPMRC